MEEYKNNKKQLILQRGKLQLENLEYTRKNIKELTNIIYGAIGENLVVKEIQKLPDNFVLINDFNLTFSPPIYYKKYHERINSIQIDHLLISNAGIFILETKNWSQSSVNSINLRSPVKQIERSNFALYKYISEKITLNKHHWGEKKIPIRNVIVMIENKPIGEFKYVSVKTLKELNNYVTYFKPIFTESETLEIINELS